MQNDTHNAPEIHQTKPSCYQEDLDNRLSGTLLAVQLASYSAVNKIHFYQQEESCIRNEWAASICLIPSYVYFQNADRICVNLSWIHNNFTIVECHSTIYAFIVSCIQSTSGPVYLKKQPSSTKLARLELTIYSMLTHCSVYRKHPRMSNPKMSTNQNCTLRIYLECLIKSQTTFLLLALRTPPSSNCCVVIDFCFSLKKLQYLIQIWMCLAILFILLCHPSR